MSKLSDRIRRVSRIEPEPMGFGAASRGRAPTLLLVGLLPDRWADRARRAAPSGVDALILTSSGSAPRQSDIRDAIKAAGDLPCGLHLPEADPEAVQNARQAGIDFIVFQAERSPAAALLDQALGYVLDLRDDLSDTELRILEALPLDAILFFRPPSPLTVRARLALQRVAALARTPVIVPIAPETAAPDLQSLRDAGAAAVALDLAHPSASSALPALRKAIDALPPRGRLRQERPAPVLPTTGPPAEEEEEEEE